MKKLKFLLYYNIIIYIMTITNMSIDNMTIYNMTIYNMTIYTFNDMPFEIQCMILNNMKCSDIVKILYNFPNSYSIIDSYLKVNNFESIEHYINDNLNNYVDNTTRDYLLNFPQRLSAIFMFFEKGYYNEAVNYCTIEDEEQFNNFIKLTKCFNYIQDAFDIVMNNDTQMVKTFIKLSYNTKLQKSTIYKLSYKLNANEVSKCIDMCNAGHNENDIVYKFCYNDYF